MALKYTIGDSKITVLDNGNMKINGVIHSKNSDIAKGYFNQIEAIKASKNASSAGSSAQRIFSDATGIKSTESTVGKTIPIFDIGELSKSNNDKTTDTKEFMQETVTTDNATAGSQDARTKATYEGLVKNETVEDKKPTYRQKTKQIVKDYPIWASLGAMVIPAIGVSLLGGLFGDDDKQITNPNPDNSKQSIPGSSGDGTVPPPDPNSPSAVYARLMEKSYGKVATPEAFITAQKDYQQMFNMKAADAISKWKDSKAAIDERREQLYDNSITGFHDTIMQALGKSNGEKSSYVLQNNQKLKSEMSKLMEGSAKLWMSMSMPENAQSMKMRAEASRDIMDVVSPGTWDKISDSAMKAASGIMQINMANAEIANKQLDMARSYAASKITNLKKAGVDIKDLIGLSGVLGKQLEKDPENKTTKAQLGDVNFKAMQVVNDNETIPYTYGK